MTSNTPPAAKARAARPNSGSGHREATTGGPAASLARGTGDSRPARTREGRAARVSGRHPGAATVASREAAAITRPVPPGSRVVRVDGQIAVLLTRHHRDGETVSDTIRRLLRLPPAPRPAKARTAVADALRRATTPMTAAQIAARAGVARSTATRALAALETEGHATRTRGHGTWAQGRTPDTWQPAHSTT